MLSKQSEQLEQCLRQGFIFDEQEKSLLVGFPLLPVAHAKGKWDPLMEQMNNGGLLADLIKDSVVERPCHSRAVKKLSDFELDKGIPWEIINIGERIDNQFAKTITTATTTTTTTTNVQEDPHARDRLYWLRVRNPQNNCTVQVVGTFHGIPMVPREWLLWHPQDQKGNLQKIAQIDCAMRDKYHDAYVEVLISHLVGLLTARNWVPHFSLFYGCFRLNHSHVWLHSYSLPTPTQFMVSEAMTTSLGHFLQRAPLRSITPRLLLSWLCSLCFALAYAQNVLGFIHDDLSPYHVGLLRLTDLQMTPLFLYYRWNGQLLRVPTGGYLVKIIHLARSSVVLQGKRMTGQGRKMTRDVFSFNTDLMKLASELLPLVSTSFGRLRCSCVTDQEDMALLQQLLIRWSSCSDVDVAQVQQQCLKLGGTGFECDTEAFIHTPTQLQCTPAIPSHQLQHFIRLFGISEDQLPNLRPIIYDLNEGASPL